MFRKRKHFRMGKGRSEGWNRSANTKSSFDAGLTYDAPLSEKGDLGTIKWKRNSDSLSREEGRWIDGTMMCLECWTRKVFMAILTCIVRWIVTVGARRGPTLAMVIGWVCTLISRKFRQKAKTNEKFRLTREIYNLDGTNSENPDWDNSWIRSVIHVDVSICWTYEASISGILDRSNNYEHLDNHWNS